MNVTVFANSNFGLLYYILVGEMSQGLNQYFKMLQCNFLTHHLTVQTSYTHHPRCVFFKICKQLQSL